MNTQPRVRTRVAMFASGVAITIGGALLGAGVAYPWGFYVFAVAALLAVLALSTVPAHMEPES